MSDDSIWSSLRFLVPSFDDLFHGRLSGLAAGFVILIFGVTLWMTCLLVVRRRAAAATVSQLTQVLEGVTRANAADMQNVMTDRADKQGGTVKALWSEFSESLVVTRDHSAVYSTVPAAEVFTPERVAPTLVGRRMLVAVPAILTAVGLLGTLMGLAMGLNGLQLGDDAGIDEITAGIQPLVHGAALGFTASFWGVLLSIATNIAERLVERSAIDSVHEFQAGVDQNFDLLTAEESLLHLETSAYESTAALQNLHEKIGSKFQEALGGMTSELASAMTRAIESAIAPTMQQLADRTADQSSEALKQLLAGFSEGFTKIGEEQARKMHEASASIDGALGSLSGQLDGFAAQVGSLTQQIERQTELLNGSLEGLAREMSASATALGSSADTLDGSSTRLDEVSQTFERTGGSLEQALENASHTVDELNAQNERAADTLRASVEGFREVAAGTTSLADSVRDAATQASVGFDGLSQKNEEFLSGLARLVEDYTNAVRNGTVERLDEWNTQTREFSTEMLNATKALSAAVDEVEAKNGAVTFAAELRRGAETLAVAIDDLSARQTSQRAAADEMLRLAQTLRATVDRAEVTLDEDQDDATVAVA